MKQKAHPFSPKIWFVSLENEKKKIHQDKKNERMSYQKIHVGQQNHDKLQTEEWLEWQS